MPRYIQRDVNTVLDLRREWEVGISGPPVEQLEEVYDALSPLRVSAKGSELISCVTSCRRRRDKGGRVSGSGGGIGREYPFKGGEGA
jgi:hypothetical protein